jgi:hypothetical protein
MPEVKTREVLFASRSPEHRLVMEPGDYIWKGPRIQGEAKGKTIEFHQGVFRTSDPAEIEFLREKLVSEPMIYEIPQEVPDPSSLLVELVDASEDRVRQILEAELDGWERPQIIEVCEKRLGAQTVAPSSEYESDDPEAPFGRKPDGTPRKRAVPEHLRR